MSSEGLAAAAYPSQAQLCLFWNARRDKLVIWPLWVPAWPRGSQPAPARVVMPQGCKPKVPMANTLHCIQESGGGARAVSHPSPAISLMLATHSLMSPFEIVTMS